MATAILNLKIIPDLITYMTSYKIVLITRPSYKIYKIGPGTSPLLIDTSELCVEADIRRAYSYIIYP